MMDPQAMVEEFHRKFDIAVSDRPSLPEEATRQLRVRLIQEEFEELQEAMVAYRNRVQEIHVPQISALPTWQLDEQWVPPTSGT